MRRSLILGVVSALSVAASASAMPGSLDSGFGTNGLGTCASTTEGYAFAAGVRAAIDPAGGVALGLVEREGTVAVCRLDSDGHRFAGFGTDGSVSLPVSGTVGDVMAAADGRVLVAVDEREGRHVKVLAVSPDGSLDGRFGRGGVAVFSNSFADQEAGEPQLMRLRDGRLRLAIAARRNGSDRWRVFGLTPRGTPDRRWNRGRPVEVDPRPRDEAANRLLAARVLPGGAVALAGTVKARRYLVGVVRLRRDGRLARRFAHGGRNVADSPLPPVEGFDPAMHIERSGHLLMAANQPGESAGSQPGGATRAFWTARLRPDGSRDRRYGRRGVGEVVRFGPRFSGTYPYVSRVERLADGRILVGGSLNEDGLRSVGSSFLLARFTARGRRDRSFGANGSAVSPLGDSLSGSYDYGQANARATDLVVDRAGRPILAGSVHETDLGAVGAAARYEAVVTRVGAKQRPASVRASTAAPDRAPRPPREFFGMTADQAFLRGIGARRERTLAAVARTGVRSLRHRLDWARVEPVQGRFDFAQYDAWAGSLARHGLRWLPILLEPPAWASTAPAQGAERGAYPPRSLDEWEGFTRAVVGRYGRGGRFWAEHPELPYRPIRVWQVWNEPSLPVFWRPTPDPRAYAELLKRTARGIRAADPQGQVLAAALPESRLGAPLATYLEALYDAGAGPAMDAVSVNGYARKPRGVLRLLERARRVMAAHGDRRKPLWLSEFGWATVYDASRGLQARSVAETMRAVARARVRLHLAGAVHYMWQDVPSVPGQDDFWGMRTGLLTEDGARKPAYRSFVRTLDELVRRPTPARSRNARSGSRRGGPPA